MSGEIPGAPLREKGVGELREVAAGPGLGEAERVGLRVLGAVVGAEDAVEVGGEVREVVRGALDPGVVPVVKLGGAQDPAQRTEGEAHVGMDEDRPEAAQDHQRAHGLEGEAEDDARQVEAELGEEAVEGVLAVGGEPVEVLDAVVHGVEAPEQVDAVAGAVEPVDDEVAEDERGEGLEREGPGVDGGAEPGEGLEVEGAGDGGEGGGDEGREDEALTEEEAEVDSNGGAAQALAGTGREGTFEGHEDEREHGEAGERGPREVRGGGHGVP